MSATPNPSLNGHPVPAAPLGVAGALLSGVEMRLAGKVAIVTGAARGIGQAIAIRFAREGASVAVVDILEAEGLATTEAIRAEGGQAAFFAADIADPDQVQQMIGAVLGRWQSLDVIVNNAGICPFADFLSLPADDWDRVLETNLKGYFLVSQAAARVMVERGIRGRIIAISSISAEFGGSQQAHYCASKAGINLLVKSMAISLGPYGITCNAILPGTVETEINRSALADPATHAYWAARAPLGRLGRPEDITGPALFFASEDSDWCTGSLLVVDGGTSVNLQ